MAEKITPSTAAREAASAFIRGNGPWREAEINLPDDDYAVQAFARFERRTLEALRTNFCSNCEAQANTIEELRSANERWVIAFKQAETDATDRIVAQANEIEWLNTLIGDKAAKQIEADGNRIQALQARVKVLEEALTPSAATKATYMSEFSLTNAAVALSANCCALDRNQDNHGDDPRPSSTTEDRTMTEIAPADQDAAARFNGCDSWEAWLATPRYDDEWVEWSVEEFARHRLAERAKIVAWLREEVGPKEMLLFNQIAWVLANCIEAGEHETFTHPDNV